MTENKLAAHGDVFPGADPWEVTDDSHEPTVAILTLVGGPAPTAQAVGAAVPGRSPGE
ncbi:MAG: hypothetical protein ACE368_17850 [Paracoccaceae bacterium]